MKRMNIQIDHRALRDTCFKEISEFSGLGETIHTPDGVAYFKDNGSKILAVAHLDTVQEKRHYRIVDARGTRIMFSPQFDDRLGAYVILHLLPSLGIKTDILLTEGEENHRSTAKYFESEKQYNWMFSFDRGGIDTVMYQYEDIETCALLRKYRFDPQRGAWSDIAVLQQLGCKGFNFGVGYYDNHSLQAFAIEHHVTHNVERLIKFFAEMKDTYLFHPKPAPPPPPKAPEPSAEQLHLNPNQLPPQQLDGELNDEDEEEEVSELDMARRLIEAHAVKTRPMNRRVCIVCRNNYLTTAQENGGRTCAACKHLGLFGQPARTIRICRMCQEDFLVHKYSAKNDMFLCLDCRICYICSLQLDTEEEIADGLHKECIGLMTLKSPVNLM